MGSAWAASLGPVTLLQGKSSSVARPGHKEAVFCASGTGVMVQGPPVPGPSQCKPYSEVQVVCLLREAMGKNVGVTHR